MRLFPMISSMVYRIRDHAEDRAVQPMLGMLLPGAGADGTLSDKAMRLIYDDIVAGKFEPGDRLKPEVLKERYDLGVSPIREGLLRLSAIGLVKLEGWRGFQVPQASVA